MHMLRDVTGLGGMLTFMLTCVTCTCYVTSLGWASKNGGKLSVIKKIVKRGSKAEPLCDHCVRRGYNDSSCERKSRTEAVVIVAEKNILRLSYKTFGG